MELRFDDKVALVTGGSSGLGQAIALGFGESGASVVVTYRSRSDEAAAVVRHVEAEGGRAIAFQGDTRIKADVDRIVEGAISHFDKVDILVNNAGVLINTPFVDISEDEWDLVLETNLKGYFLFGQAVARHMIDRRAGHIVNVSSTRQIQAHPANASYCASKGGIFMLTRVMATELAPHGIRVNSIAPGTIPTNLNPELLQDEELVRRRLSTIPTRQFGKPKDVVAATLLLASDQADFINGASLMIDGGQTIW